MIAVLIILLPSILWAAEPRPATDWFTNRLTRPAGTTFIGPGDVDGWDGANYKVDMDAALLENGSLVFVEALEMSCDGGKTWRFVAGGPVTTGTKSARPSVPGGYVSFNTRPSVGCQSRIRVEHNIPLNFGGDAQHVSRAQR